MSCCESRLARPLPSRIHQLPGATIYHVDGIPYGLVADRDLLLVARLDVPDDNNALTIQGGIVGPCSCDAYETNGDCIHRHLTRRWLADQIPSAVRTAAALAADAAGMARGGRPAQARAWLSMARRLVRPHVDHWDAARQVAATIEEIEGILSGLRLEVAA